MSRSIRERLDKKKSDEQARSESVMSAKRKACPQAQMRLPQSRRKRQGRNRSAIKTTRKRCIVSVRRSVRRLHQLPPLPHQQVLEVARVAAVDVAVAVARDVAEIRVQIR